MMAAATHHCPVCGKTASSSTANGGGCSYCLLQLALSASGISPASGGIRSSTSSGKADSRADRFVRQGVLPQFGDYELESEIARGGMGVVYRARQRSLNRIVAIKMILAGQLATPESVQRFRLEAEAAARLHHPGIVPIYEIGEYETQHFFSMELIDGISLAECLHEFYLKPGVDASEKREQELCLAELLSRVARALDFAHQRGVLHRDLKPSNILIDEQGRPHLTDFGLAKLTGRETSGLTLSNAVLGTPGYLAPEQVAGRTEVTTAADVYGLGATLYELLTGQPPFVGSTAVETMWMATDRPPTPPRQINSSVHRDLETIALRCLEKKPEQRYRSAAEVADELERFIRREPILARPVGRAEQVWRWCQRNRRLATMACALIVAILSGSGGAVWQWSQAVQLKARTLVDAMATARTSDLGGMHDELAPYERWAVPLLRERLLQDGLSDAAWLNMTLALLPFEPQRSEKLAPRLLDQNLEDFEVVRDALVTQKEKLIPSLWQTLEREDMESGRRLRAACCLTAYDPQAASARSGGWSVYAEMLAEEMIAAVRKDPSTYAPLLRNLRPIADSLHRPLVDVMRDARRGEASRALALSVLIDYAGQRSDVLAELLTQADVQQFPVVWRVLAPQAAAGHGVLRKRLRQPAPTEASEEEKDRFASQQANAAVALLLSTGGEEVWPLFRHSPEPRVRSYLTHRAAPLGVPATLLVARLDREADVSARRSLVLTLGEYTTAQLPEDRRADLLPKLVHLYRTDPDAGLHSAVEWLIRHWDGAALLEKSETEFTGKTPPQQNWFINGQGQAFTIVRGPVAFDMGDPLDLQDMYSETTRRATIEHSYAIGAKEVTVAEFDRFTGQQSPPADQPLPVVEVSWFQFGVYCNWLSQQEGLPPEQWCYEAVPDDNVGMRLVPDFIRRTGYRLPTEAEWAYSCRAGALTRRFYGHSEELLPKYAWHAAQAGSAFIRRPVGLLKPNDLGLFDVLGNALEFTSDRFTGPALPGTRVGREGDWYLIRGGAFWHPTFLIRCTSRIALPPSAQGFSNGFRLARTLPTE